MQMLVIKDLRIAYDSCEQSLMHFLVVDEQAIYSKEPNNILRMYPFSSLILIFKCNLLKQYNKVKILLLFNFLPIEICLFHQVDLHEQQFTQTLFNPLWQFIYFSNYLVAMGCSLIKIH